jgi:hypothetical protein
MISSITLSISPIILLFITIVQAQDSEVSTANNDNVKVGWQDGPDQRGTTTLVWSALPAWNFEFPTETEHMIWMVVSIPLPLYHGCLDPNMIVVSSLHRAMRILTTVL